MQEDKEPALDVAQQLPLCIAALIGMMQNMQIHTHAMQAAAEDGYATATDLADWLVRTLDVPFREAHHITGKIVRLAEDAGCALSALPLEKIQMVDPRITDAVFDVLSVKASVTSRTSYGGTAPANVKAAIAEARKRMTS